METTFDYCRKNRVLGVGWRTTSRRNTSNWDEYYQEASQAHDDLRICEYVRSWVKDGDLVWTRDPRGNYYLALVISGWEYWSTPESIEKDIDVENIFRCVLRPVDIDEVPGKVVACFRARRTIQRICDSKAVEYSKYLWNVLSDEQLFEVDKSQYSDIFMMLDDEETEDVLFLYLQHKGWYVLPNSRKGDTMSFEYLVVDATERER